MNYTLEHLRQKLIENNLGRFSKKAFMNETFTTDNRLMIGINKTGFHIWVRGEDDILNRALVEKIRQIFIDADNIKVNYQIIRKIEAAGI